MTLLSRCAAVAAWLATIPAGGAQGFQPADYGTVTLHLKADALALANNSPVPSWGPLAAAGTSQPTFLASDPLFNNKPSVRFDGVNDVFTKSTANLSARTIFAVVTAETGNVNLAGLISNGSDGLNVRRNNTTPGYRAVGAGQDGNDFSGNGTPTGTLTVNNGTTALYTPGVAHLVIAIAGAQKNYSTFWLGNASASLVRYWKGSVAEVLIYDGTLTPAGVNAVGYYLQTKYQLPTTFASPDPRIAFFTGSIASGVSSPSGILSTANAPVSLTWSTSQATEVTMNQGITLTPPALSGSVVVSPTATTTYTLTARNSLGTSVTADFTVHIGVTPLPPRINEFAAENANGLTDTDGTTPDWIEIFNPNAYGIDLNGLQLRDSTALWNFPVGSGIAAAGYRVILADSKNLTDPASTLHTNFSLSNNGELLLLTRLSDNAVLTAFSPGYPPQYGDASYGFYGSPPQLGYFGKPGGNPTPGAANNATGVLGFLDQTDDTRFTVGRGFHTSAVTTVLSAMTPGATLVFTTNGSDPTLTNGQTVLPADANTPPSITLTIHPGAVPAGAPAVNNIASTGGVTTLRAAAFLTGYAPTNTDTQTYLFPSGILTQTPGSAFSRGWPTAPVNGQIFNFGMDPNVVNSFTVPQMEESLQSLPTLSIVTNQANLTASATGIYVNADQHGDAWERPISLELIHPPGYVSPDGNAEGFQIDGGLRMRGGFSRNDQFFKHGFRLFFSRKYDGKLNYPLFGSEGTNQFGKLDLGTGSNYAWYRESDYNNGRFNTMVRDPFCRDTQGALGQPYTKSRYYHLYLNGTYWGLYYTEERAEAEFAASYFGGDDSEYDAVKCGNHIGNFQTEATDGTLAAWQTLWTRARSLATGGATLAKYFELEGRNPDGTRNPVLPVLLDIDNLIAEMLVIFYSGDGDAVLSNFLNHDRPNNWFSIYRRNGADGFRFFIRDAEHTLGATNWVNDQTGPWPSIYTNDFTYSNPQLLHQDLSASPEYRLRFADQVRKHFFDGGALTPAATLARFQKRANQLPAAMRAESARWGDAQSITNLPSGHPPRYLVSDWEAAIAFAKTSILPGRTATVLNQLRTDALYPNLAAPALLDANGQPAYQVSSPATFSISLNATAGTLYYTTNGGDPRSPGGAVSPGALTGASPLSITLTATSRIRARVLSGTVWSALTNGEYLIGTLANHNNLVISQVQYKPATADGLAEFLEIMNISAGAVDLTNCSFSSGFSFKFPDNYILAPGSRALLVRSQAAFLTAWPAFKPTLIAGVFANDTALSNGGETIELRAANGAVIQSFAYNNKSPWPEEADGTGPSLVLINPLLNPDPANPLNWRRSVPGNGSPNASDALPYSSWLNTQTLTGFNNPPDSDPDGDNLPNLMEYALGTSPTAVTPPPLLPALIPLTVEGLPNTFLTTNLTYPPGRDDVRLTVETSVNLAGPWLPAVPAGLSVGNPDGTTTWPFRHPDPASAASRQFLRLKAVKLN